MNDILKEYIRLKLLEPAQTPPALPEPPAEAVNKNKEQKYIAIGNPPFGYRGWLALSFLNHAAEFCEYVGFILPMSFQSEGKGSPKYRVPGMKLVHHEVLPDGLFIQGSGDKTSVNTLWQIWEKGEDMKAPDYSLCDEYFPRSF